MTTSGLRIHRGAAAAASSYAHALSNRAKQVAPEPRHARERDARSCAIEPLDHRSDHRRATRPRRLPRPLRLLLRIDRQAGRDRYRPQRGEDHWAVRTPPTPGLTKQLPASPGDSPGHGLQRSPCPARSRDSP